MRLKEIQKNRTRDESVRKFAEDGKTSAEIAEALSLTIGTVNKIRVALKAVEEGKPDPRPYMAELPWREVEDTFFKTHLHPYEWRKVADELDLGEELVPYEIIETIFRDLDPALCVCAEDQGSRDMDPVFFARLGDGRCAPPRPWSKRIGGLGDDDPRQALYEKHYDVVREAWRVETEIDGDALAEDLKLSAALVNDMLEEILFRKYGKIPDLLKRGFDKWEIADLLHLSLEQVYDYISPRYPSKVRGLYAFGEQVPGDQGNWLPRPGYVPPPARSCAPAPQFKENFDDARD